MNLLYSDAEVFVRSRMDELSYNPSQMAVTTDDDRNLSKTIEQLLPEAIMSVHIQAPASLMEGIELNYPAPLEDDEEADVDDSGTSTIDAADEPATDEEDAADEPATDEEDAADEPATDEEEAEDETVDYDLPSCSGTDGVLTIDFTDTNRNILRMVSFKDGKSDILLTKNHFEGSTIARLQKNKYMRGTPDCPVMVRVSESNEYKPVYKYYTTPNTGDKTNSSGAVTNPISFRMEYFPVPSYVTGTGFFISAMLETATLTYLTALVFQTYGQADYANIFFQRAADALK